MADAGVGLYGSVMFIIWILLSQTDATSAYVDAPIVTVVTDIEPPSFVKPSTLSARADAGAGFEGSVMSMIWRLFSV